MSEGHVHLTQQCVTHGFRLGGCRCMTTLAERHRYEQTPCTPLCPGANREEGASLAEATWDDVYMGEPDE